MIPMIYDIEFSNALYIPLVACLAGISFLITLYKYFKIKRVVTRLVSPIWSSLLMKHGSGLKRSFKLILFFLGIVGLLLAVLRPSWDKKEENVMQEGRDVLIAIDISRSMLATDQKPNRLQLVKEKIRKLLSNLSCERVGLVLFSGASLMQCPLTKDYHAFFMFLDQISIESISSGSTALDQPIETALKVFKDVSQSATKLLVLFTDGEDFAGNVKALEQKIVDENLCIVTCGVGTVHGAPVPVFDQEGRQIGYEKDAQGNIVMTCLNEPLLKQIAQDSKGVYVHIKNDSDDDLVSIIHKVESFETYQMQERQVSTLQEQYPYFVAASLVCFLLEWIL